MLSLFLEAPSSSIGIVEIYRWLAHEHVVITTGILSAISWIHKGRPEIRLAKNSLLRGDVTIGLC